MRRREVATGGVVRRAGGPLLTLLLWLALSALWHGRNSLADEPTLPPACPPTQSPPNRTASVPRQMINDRQNDGATMLAFSPDGRMLATASNARSARIWDFAQRAPLRTIRLPQVLMPWTLAWNSEGTQLAIGQMQSYLVDVGREEVVAAFHGASSWPDGRWIQRVPRHDATPWVGASYPWLYLFDKDGARGPKLFAPADKSTGVGIREIAVSADGEVIVAALGAEGAYAWRTATAEREARRLPVDDPAEHIAVTPDGETAVVVTKDKNGHTHLHVIGVRNGKETGVLRRSDDWDLVTSVAISPDGALLAVGSVGHIRVWQLSSAALIWDVPRERASPMGQIDAFGGIIESVAFAPTGGTLAVGCQRGNIFLFDSQTGHSLGELGQAVRRPYFLRFSRDARSLLAVGSHGVSRWSLADAKVEEVQRLAGMATTDESTDHDFILALAPISLKLFISPEQPPCPAGVTPFYFRRWSQRETHSAESAQTSRAVVLTYDAATPSAKQASEPFPAGPLCIPGGYGIDAIHEASRSVLVNLRDPMRLGVLRLPRRELIPLQYSEQYGSAQLSADGTSAVASNLREVTVWDTKTGVRRRTVAVPGFTALAPIALSTDARLLAVSGAIRTEVVDVDSGRKRWSVNNSHFVTTLAFRSQTAELLAGTFEGAVLLLREGQPARELNGGGGPVVALAVSANGQVAATVHQDGGVRIWDLVQGTQRATLVDFDDDEWVVTTPGGAFKSTDEGAERLGWVFDAPMEHFRFEQFASHFRNADLVRQRLSGLDVDVAGDIRRPPSLTLKSVVPEGSTSARIQVHVTSDSRVDALWVFREGRALGAQALCKAQGDAELSVPLLPGVNNLSVSASDERQNFSNPLPVKIVAPRSRNRPELWIISVGVSSYPNLPPEAQLRVAHLDAQAIAEAFARQAGPGKLFAPSPHIAVLLDDKASVTAIRAALGELARMAPDDLAVIFLAGHGVRADDEANMRFLTSASTATRQSVAADGIGWSEIADKLAAARGRVLMLLDACHSGHISRELVVANGALAARLTRSGRAGVLVFAAAKGREESFERAEHGMFTEAILDTLKRRDADRDGDGELQISEFLDTVTVQVQHLSHGLQTPWVARRELIGDFKIATLPR